MHNCFGLKIAMKTFSFDVCEQKHNPKFSSRKVFISADLAAAVCFCVFSLMIWDEREKGKGKKVKKVPDTLKQFR